jgi:hypothetical protein
VPLLVAMVILVVFDMPLTEEGDNAHIPRVSVVRAGSAPKADYLLAPCTGRSLNHETLQSKAGL